MSRLTVTAKGQVTLRQQLLRHLGVHPNAEIAAEKLPNGRIEINRRASREGFRGVQRPEEIRQHFACARGTGTNHRPSLGRQAMR